MSELTNKLMFTALLSVSNQRRGISMYIDFNYSLYLMTKNTGIVVVYRYCGGVLVLW